MSRTKIGRSVLALLFLFGIVLLLVFPGPSYAECCSCTCYAWAKRPDLRGICTRDAKFWDDDAREAGYPIGKAPQVGAIVVFDARVQDADRNYGHVAYVEEVYSSSEFRLSEKGCKPDRCEVNYRLAHTGESVSFIYRVGRGNYFEIVAKHSDKCLDVYGASHSSGAHVIQSYCHGGDNQLWSLIPVGDHFQIVAKHSGKCLEVYGAFDSSGAHVIQADCHGGDNQLWSLVPVGDHFQIVAKHSGKCLDVYEAFHSSGAHAVQGDCHAGENQLWELQAQRGEGTGTQVGYQAHVAGFGWVGWTRDGQVAGTTGQARRMEAVRIWLEDAPAGMRIRYRVHVAGFSWLNWVHDGDMAGTTGQYRRMEAIQIQLEGNPANLHVCYRAHVAGHGWLGWVCDGAAAGTTGQYRRMEALQIRLESR